MKTLPSIFIIILFAMFTLLFHSCDFLSSLCDDTETQKAEKLADEMCDCYNSEQIVGECDTKYLHEYRTTHSEEFLNAFNRRAKKCGIELKNPIIGQQPGSFR